jgi:hypothetical protein
MCDEHDDRIATVRIQGETDSFGCEMGDYCQECADKIRAEIIEERSKPHYCNWCKQEKTGVRAYRDIDEGMCGPVYQVCGDCRGKCQAALAKEHDEYYADDVRWDY